MPRKKLVIDEDHVMSLKVVGLRKLCTKYKLAKKGRKAELQDRILEHLQLGKYAVVASVEPTEESELETASTEQSEPQEQKVQGEQSQDSANNLPEEGESKVERKVDSPKELDTVTEEIVDNTEKKATGIKRTSSEATISDGDSIAEKKRKITETLETEELELASAEADSKEAPESINSEFPAEQEKGDSEQNVSISTKTVSEIKSMDTESQELADDDEEEVVQQKNVEKKLVEPLLKAPVTTEEKTEEIVSKAQEPKEDVDEKASGTISTASDSAKKIDNVVSEAVESKKANEIIPKDVESKKKISVSPHLKKQKKIIPSKKPASNSQKEEKESKSTNDKDGRKPSKSNKWKKKWKGKDSKSNRSYQQRDVQKRRDQNSKWGNRNKRDRNWNRNRGYQSSNRQSQPSWLYPQENWRNSMPAPRQQRGWNSGGGWQQQSFYIGGYGNDSRRSGSGRGWGNRNSGRWENRRNVWRGNKRGRSGRR